MWTTFSSNKELFSHIPFSFTLILWTKTNKTKTRVNVLGGCSPPPSIVSVPTYHNILLPQSYLGLAKIENALKIQGKHCWWHCPARTMTQRVSCDKTQNNHSPRIKAKQSDGFQTLNLMATVSQGREETIPTALVFYVKQENAAIKK